MKPHILVHTLAYTIFHSSPDINFIYEKKRTILLTYALNYLDSIILNWGFKLCVHFILLILVKKVLKMHIIK